MSPHNCILFVSGTMTGGGARVIKGKMSSKMQSEFTPEQVAKLKKKLETEEASYEASIKH